MKRKDYSWELPTEIERRLGESTYGRQRAIYEKEHLLLILHSPPKPETDVRECVVFLRKPSGQWMCNGQENGESQLRQLLTSYARLQESMERQYDEARDARGLFDLLDNLTPLNRSTTNMEKALQQAREFAQDDVFLIGMRDQAYEISRDYDLLIADVRLALDYRLARHSELQAEQSAKMAAAQHKLNILAALTFPLMATATLFGMNLASGLEKQGPGAFWVVLTLGICLGFGFKSYVTKEQNDAAGAGGM